MDRREQKRRVPLARLAAIVVALLVAAEALVIAGVLEMRAGTVAKHAPWAFEPFLRLVGEHPESMPRRAAAVEEGGADPAGSDSAIARIAGFRPDEIPVQLGTNLLPATEAMDPAGPTEPAGEAPATNAPATGSNAPAEKAEAVVPVG